MEKFNNTLEVFKLLPKTNCRKCNKPTCLAFAAAMFPLAPIHDAQERYGQVIDRFPV